jgi:hypothetical protein
MDETPAELRRRVDQYRCAESDMRRTLAAARELRTRPDGDPDVMTVLFVGLFITYARPYRPPAGLEPVPDPDGAGDYRSSLADTERSLLGHTHVYLLVLRDEWVEHAELPGGSMTSDLLQDGRYRKVFFEEPIGDRIETLCKAQAARFSNAVARFEGRLREAQRREERFGKD